MPRRPSPIPSDDSESFTSTSNGILTPRTDAAATLSSSSIDGGVRLGGGGPHGNEELAQSTNYFMTGANHSRTPSLSFTSPPTTESGSHEHEQSSLEVGREQERTTSRGSLGSIDGRLGDLRLSSHRSGSSMSDVENALDRLVVPGTPGPDAVPSSEGSHLRTSGSRATRRRSSSQNAAVHDVRDEPPPPDRFYDPSFQQAFSTVKRIMSDLSNVLSSSTLHNEQDSTMRRLHTDALRLSTFQCPSTRTVGFVGDSGVGKSSLLNSLLDYKDLAKAGSSGAACTCVVTEYHYRDAHDFRIDVEAFTQGEILDQLTNHLRSYRHYHLRGDLMTPDEAVDKEALRERANLAIDTFRAMFRNRLNEQELLELPEEMIIESFRSHVAEIDPENLGICEEVPESLISKRLEELTSEQESSNFSAWPYIRKIRVYLRAHILSKGLVLVDLPGLRDLNSARRNITELYLRQCNEIFVVCFISRATDDPGVKTVINLAKQANLSNISIVCTRSDDIRVEEEEKTRQDPRAKEIETAANATKLELEVARANLDTLLVDEGLSEEDREKDELALRRKIARLEKEMKHHKFRLRRFFIEFRNIDVTKKLQQNYGKDLPSRSIVSVFCVSNEIYRENRDRPKAEALERLELSGIIQLRRHCMSIVSESQLHLARNYMTHDISALLTDVELWIRSGAGRERESATREILDVLEARLKTDLTGSRSEVHNISESLNQSFQDLVIYDHRQRQSQWNIAAKRWSQIWSGFHHSIYAAFCSRYGDYETSKLDHHHIWNAEVIEGMVRDLGPRWDVFMSATLNNCNTTIELASGCMTWAAQYLDTELGDSDSTRVLRIALWTRRHLLLDGINDACSGLEDDLLDLKTDMLSGVRTSLIGLALETTYENAIMRGGPGSFSRKKHIINSKVEDPRLFTDLIRQTKGKVRALSFEFQSRIREIIEDHLSHLESTLNLVRDENVALESERDPAFRCRVEDAATLARAEIRALLQVLADEQP